MRHLLIIAACVVLCPFSRAGDSEATAAALIEKTGVSGGLCLLAGAADPSVATALAGKSAFYVQVLQPDSKLALKWGVEIAGSELREKAGVRNAAFDPEHYGSDLFNLIVVEDPAAVGKATLTGLERILVPGGWIAFKTAPASFAAEAKTLGMETRSAGAYSAVFGKAVKPIEWKICDSLKWRAGPRAQLSSGWASVSAGDGKFFYRERMEIPGTLDASGSQLFARDANNGRLLWSIDDDKWRDPRPLAAAKGKVFTPMGEKLVCLDSNTGKQLFELMPAGLGFRWSLTRIEVVDDLVLASGEIGFRAFSINDGKEIWRIAADSWIYAQGKLITSSHGQFQARSLKEPTKIIWTGEQGGHFALCSDKFLILNKKEFATEAPEYVALNLETGKVAWTYVFTSQFKKGRAYACTCFGDKFYPMATNAYENKAQDLWITRLDMNTGKVEGDDIGPKGADPFNMCAPGIHKAGKYLVFFFSVWIDLEKNTRVFPYLAHPSCAIGTLFFEGKMFNIPSRKCGALQGISAMGPADITFDHEPGGKVLRKFDAAQTGAETKEDDWPMFRANPARGNAVNAKLGEKPAKIWETSISLGGKSFGVMSGERTGLTQPVSAYGLVIVSDIDAQRIVAVETTNGKQKWIYAVGSRVDFPPTLYKGLCLFAAKDGWVHCLNAADGTLAWKLLITPAERLIGGQEKLESQWAMVSDVMVAGGVGYACAGLSFDNLGGGRAVAFKPETGEVVWSQTYYEEKHQGYGGGQMVNLFTAGAGAKGPVVAMGGKPVEIATGKLLQGNVSGMLEGLSDDYLGGGVSIPRNAEDRGPVGISDGRIWGKTVAFDKDLSVAYASGYGAETWENKLKLNLYAKKTAGKTNLWEKLDNEMTVDDIVLTPEFAYCAGHYQRVKKDPELLVVSRDDGKIVNSIPVEGYPAFMGMSAAGNKLFLATREGKLLCYAKQ